MGTGSLVGISSYQEIAEQTAPGIGNAHGAVDKGLNLHILRDMGTDLANLLQGKLSCGNHAGGSLRCQKLHAFRTCDRHLGAGVKVKSRKFLLQNRKHAHILHDHRIQPPLIVWL